MPHIDNDTRAEFTAFTDNAKHHAKHREDFNCRRCGELVRGDTLLWNFYNLCDVCFKEFDNQKMAGRFKKYFGQAHEYGETFEFAEEWIKAHPFTGSNK